MTMTTARRLLSAMLDRDIDLAPRTNDQSSGQGQPHVQPPQPIKNPRPLGMIGFTKTLLPHNPCSRNAFLRHRGTKSLAKPQADGHLKTARISRNGHIMGRDRRFE